MVLLMGDNGYFLGERGLAGKWLIYEESIRVPLIVMDPRAPQPRRGAVESATALNVDLAPTLLAAATSLPLARSPAVCRALPRSRAIWRDLPRPAAISRHLVRISQAGGA